MFLFADTEKCIYIIAMLLWEKKRWSISDMTESLKISLPFKNYVSMIVWSVQNQG